MRDLKQYVFASVVLALTIMTLQGCGSYSFSQATPPLVPQSEKLGVVYLVEIDHKAAPGTAQLLRDQHMGSIGLPGVGPRYTSPEQNLQQKLPVIKRDLLANLRGGLGRKGYVPEILNTHVEPDTLNALQFLRWDMSKDVEQLRSQAKQLAQRYQLSSVLFIKYSLASTLQNIPVSRPHPSGEGFLVNMVTIPNILCGKGALHWFDAEGNPLQYAQIDTPKEKGYASIKRTQSLGGFSRVSYVPLSTWEWIDLVSAQILGQIPTFRFNRSQPALSQGPTG